MLSKASLTRLALAGSGSRIISSRLSGLICYVKPHLSVTQPQDIYLPPLDNTSQSLSISAWSLQYTWTETASVSLYIGPPTNAQKRWPLSSKSIDCNRSGFQPGCFCHYLRKTRCVRYFCVFKQRYIRIYCFFYRAFWHPFILFPPILIN